MPAAKSLRSCRKISDEPLKTCPDCSGQLTKLISRTSFQLKGTGWYVTDYARKPESQPKSEGESKPAADSKSGAEAKSGAESKPAAESSGSGTGSRQRQPAVGLRLQERKESFLSKSLSCCFRVGYRVSSSRNCAPHRRRGPSPRATVPEKSAGKGSPRPGFRHGERTRCRLPIAGRPAGDAAAGGSGWRNPRLWTGGTRPARRGEESGWSTGYRRA